MSKNIWNSEFILGDTVLFEGKIFNDLKIKKNFFVASEIPILLLSKISYFSTEEIDIGRVHSIERTNGKFYDNYFYMVDFNRVQHCRMLLTERCK